MYSRRPDSMIQGTRLTLVCTAFRIFILTHCIIGLIDKYRESDCEMHIMSACQDNVFEDTIMLSFVPDALQIDVLYSLHYCPVQPSRHAYCNL